MGKIKEEFEFGKPEDLDMESLVRQLRAMYRDLSQAINQKPSVFIRSTDGQTSDTILSNGDISINSTTQKVEMLTQHTNTTTVNWTTLS